MKKTMFTAEKKGDNILMDNQSNGTDRSLSFGKMVAVIVNMKDICLSIKLNIFIA